MNRPLRLERPQLLTDLVVERIRAAIVNGEFGLGSQMSEAQLAQQLGVSKTPVREALLRLKSEGLVEIHPQRGSFVFQLTPEQVAQLCHYRAMVETAALREAFAANPSGLAQQMARCVAEMRPAEKAKDLKALARIDMDFHGQFLAFCPNAYLKSGYDVIRSQLTALRHRSPIANAVSSHKVLLDAVAAGDIDGACALLVEHVLENEPRYRAACNVA
ncbi:MAG: GntR family transcriptional regulator [Piscinibacter sp.]